MFISCVYIPTKPNQPFNMLLFSVFTNACIGFCLQVQNSKVIGIYNEYVVAMFLEKIMEPGFIPIFSHLDVLFQSQRNSSLLCRDNMLT